MASSSLLSGGPTGEDVRKATTAPGGSREGSEPTRVKAPCRAPRLHALWCPTRGARDRDLRRRSSAGTEANRREQSISLRGKAPFPSARQAVKTVEREGDGNALHLESGPFCPRPLHHSFLSRTPLATQGCHLAALRGGGLRPSVPPSEQSGPQANCSHCLPPGASCLLPPQAARTPSGSREEGALLPAKVGKESPGPAWSVFSPNTA